MVAIFIYLCQSVEVATHTSRPRQVVMADHHTLHRGQIEEHKHFFSNQGNQPPTTYSSTRTKIYNGHGWLMIRLVKPFQLYVAVLGKSFRCGFWSHYQIRRAVTPYFHYGWGLSRMRPTLYSSALQHFERSNAIEIHNGTMFDFYQGLPHTIYMYVLKVLHVWTNNMRRHKDSNLSICI